MISFSDLYDENDPRGNEIAAMTHEEDQALARTYHACEVVGRFGDGENATAKEQIEAMQYLIDTGMVWRMEGHYGRTARRMIDAGVCHA